MAYNTTAIKTDVNGKPIPQYFDPLADEYKPLLGQHGAARSILYGPDGQPIGTAENPLQVKAHDTDAALDQIKDALGPLATEAKLEAVRTLLASLVGKDFATQTTLAQIKQVLDTLNGIVSTSSNQDALKSELANIKANQLSGDQKVTLSGTIAGVTPHYNLRTVANAVSIPPGAYQDFSLGLTGDERYVYILINVSQQPWSILGFNELGGRALSCLYPEYDKFTAIFTNFTVPARVLYCPVRYRVLFGENPDPAAIATLAERSYKGLVTTGNDKVRFVNDSNEINTVTLRVQTY